MGRIQVPFPVAWEYRDPYWDAWVMSLGNQTWVYFCYCLLNGERCYGYTESQAKAQESVMAYIDQKNAERHARKKQE